MMRRRTQETITLAVMRMTTKVSRTISLRKEPASLRTSRKTRNLRGILKRLLRNLRKSTPHLRDMYLTPRYRGSS